MISWVRADDIKFLWEPVGRLRECLEVVVFADPCGVHNPVHALNLSISRVASNRTCANKSWNAARFVIGHLDTWNALPKDALTEIADDLPARWIRSRLNRTVADVSRLMDDYQFGQAGTRNL